MTPDFCTRLVIFYFPWNVTVFNQVLKWSRNLLYSRIYYIFTPAHVCHNFSYELQVASDMGGFESIRWLCAAPLQLSVWFLSVRVQRWSSGSSSFILMLGPSDLLELMLNSPLLLPAPRNESPLLLVQQGFKLRGLPRLVVGETRYRPGWRRVLYAEVDMVCGAVCQAVDVISMTAAECLLVCGLERVPQSLTCLIGPHFHRLLCS